MTEATPPRATVPETLRVIPSPLTQRLDPATLFAVEQPLHVELGSGDGSFLAEFARAHPAINFIGLERLLGRLRKLDRKGRRLGLANLRLIRVEASYFVRHLLPYGSIEAIHLYFPDPWPKRRHWKHRLVNPTFADDVLAALQPGGAIWLRTDNVDYFAQMLEVFNAHAGFEAIPTPPELAAFKTDFERHWNGMGIPTQYAAYRKRG